MKTHRQIRHIPEVMRGLQVAKRSDTAKSTPRNVVMVVLDDLGFANLGCFGSNIHTPNIDRLAEQGLRYNRFHVTALCSPTRASLLTGRNHHAVGMGCLPEASIHHPGYSGRIPKSAASLARILKDGGYNTFAAGKWHITPKSEASVAGPFDRWPTGMGFERYYGFLGGLTDQWTPELVRDNGIAQSTTSSVEGYHVTEDLTSQAIRFVQEQQQAAPDKPYFLYFATGAMHSPHQVPSEWVEPYRDQFNDGWDALRNRLYARQQRLGVIPADATLTGRPPWVPAWHDLSKDERRLFSRQMEVYAGFLTHTDAQIGQLISFLSEADTLDDTIVILLSDNGASPDGGPHGFVRPGEPGDVDSMVAYIDDLGSQRAFNHYSWGWAWAGNTPFKLWKHYTWLGGVRVPLIIRSPEISVNGNGGQIRSQFCHAIDVMPTILDATGVEPQAMVDGVPQQMMDGASLRPTFTDAGAPSPRMTQYFEMEGSRAIYHDGWKATTDHVRPADVEEIQGSDSLDRDAWSLYHLDNDFSEAQDLSEIESAKLREMIELWWSEAGRNQVLPLPDRDLWERAIALESTSEGPNTYVYKPSGGPIVTPRLSAGFQITAYVDLAGSREAGGVICAQGNRHAGWALYVLEGAPRATFNFGGYTGQTFVGDTLEPAGTTRLGIVVNQVSAGTYHAHIVVDGRVVASGSIAAHPGRLWYIRHYTKLRLGEDPGFTVSDQYQAPFPFAGIIDRVVFETGVPGASAPLSGVKTALSTD